MCDSGEPIWTVRVARKRRPAEIDYELEELPNDETARKGSFERKMDSRTATESIATEDRDAELIVAGQFTRQFLTELDVHFEILDTEI